jgi:hypothetical protein
VLSKSLAFLEEGAVFVRVSSRRCCSTWPHCRCCSSSKSRSSHVEQQQQVLLQHLAALLLLLLLCVVW